MDDITGLIAIPFTRNAYKIDTGGAGSSGSIQDGNTTWNTDGSMSAMYLSADSGGFAEVTFAFYGTKFGVRFRYDAKPFGVKVDGGKVVPVYTNRRRDGEQYLNIEAKNSGNNHEVRVVTHPELSDGIHFARIQVSKGNSVMLAGYLVSDRAGYRAPTRVCITSDPITVSNGSLASISPVCALMGSSAYFRYVTKMIYTNTTAGALTLTVANAGGTTLFTKSIAANDSYVLDFPICALGLGSNSGGGKLQHQSSGSGMIAVAFGGYV